MKVFTDGFPVWKKTAGNFYAVEASYVKKKIDAKANVVIVDSRPTRPKFVKGHIPGAISIPDSKFAKFKSNLPTDKSTPLIFYCGGYT